MGSSFCLGLLRFSCTWRRPEPQQRGSWWRRQGAWRGTSFMAAAAWRRGNWATSGKIPVAGRERQRGVTPSSTASITLPARPAPCVQPCQVTLRPALRPRPPPSRSHRHTPRKPLISRVYLSRSVEAPRVAVSEAVGVMSKLHVACIKFASEL